MTTDHQLLEFLRKLAEDQRGSNGLLISEWETRFVSSFSSSSRQTLWLTEGRRTAVDRMWRKYGGELGHPHPSDLIEDRGSKIEDADSGCCTFLMRDEADRSRQQRCNAPAVARSGKLLYCSEHRDQVKQRLPETHFQSL